MPSELTCWRMIVAVEKLIHCARFVRSAFDRFVYLFDVCLAFGVRPIVQLIV